MVLIFSRLNFAVILLYQFMPVITRSERTLTTLWWFPKRNRVEENQLFSRSRIRILKNKITKHCKQINFGLFSSLSVSEGKRAMVNNPSSPYAYPHGYVL